MANHVDPPRPLPNLIDQPRIRNPFHFSELTKAVGTHSHLGSAEIGISRDLREIAIYLNPAKPGSHLVSGKTAKFVIIGNMSNVKSELQLPGPDNSKTHSIRICLRRKQEKTITGELANRRTVTVMVRVINLALARKILRLSRE